jgi:hypothetical protein
MVERPDPARINSIGRKPRWASFQIEPVTSRPVSQRQIPGGLLSPNHLIRKTTAAEAKDPGNLISTVLMDPVQEVRRAATKRIADLYSSDDYAPGFAIRLAVCCSALSKSKDPTHNQIAALLASEITSRTTTDQRPEAAFGTIITALFYPDAVEKSMREKARLNIANDSRLITILNAIAKKLLLVEDESIPDKDVYISPSEISHNERTLLDLDPACAVIACLAKSGAVSEKGASFLASLCDSERRSQFSLRMLAFLATPISTNDTAVTFGRLQFDAADIASVVPWLVLRYGSRPEASSPDDELARASEVSGSAWATLSAPLLEKLDQYCATGYPSAIIGAARLLRAFSWPKSDQELTREALDVAFAQLGALKNLRIAANFSDAVLAHEISAQIKLIAQKCPDYYQPKPEATQTIEELSKLGVFQPRGLISIARNIGGITFLAKITHNLLAQVQLGNLDEGLSVRARSLKAQESLRWIAEGIAATLNKTLQPDSHLSGEIVAVFSYLSDVVAHTTNHDEFATIYDRFVNALKFVSYAILPAQRKDFHFLVLNNLTRIITESSQVPNAPLCKLLFNLLDSPPSPSSVLSEQQKTYRFVGLSSGQLIKLFQVLSKNLPQSPTGSGQSDFDLAEIMVDTLTVVSHFLLSQDWGAQNGQISREDLSIAISATQALINNRKLSGGARAKARILLTFLEGN